jgi:uncharacterized membrane protein YeaQ/YmgE (transglycosylase-associated protein family)
MFTWSFLIWIAIGGFAGLFARRLIGGVPPFGTIGDVILGIAGGAVGGILLSLAGDAAAFVWLIGSLVTAVLGALLLVWLAGVIKGKPG